MANHITKQLDRSLGLSSVYSIAVGAMMGSGIFVLPGLAAAIAGPWVALSYMLAGFLVIPALFSKAELATAMPVAGGTFVYVQRSMGPWMGTVVGLGTWFALTAKTAFALVGLGGYLILFSEAPALQQIVGELLCNAREFSKPSGQIHLEIQVDEEGNGLLRVSDTGPGFPPEFDSSELVRAFVSTKKPGKGVGLAAVHSRILAHGGHLRLFNNGGAVVECFFPAVPSVVAPSQDPLDVWVVEDEPALLDFIVDVLESKGFKVLAFSGAEALLEAYVVDAHDPDVLLLDVVLPGTSGPELHRALQQRGFDSAVLWSSGFTADAAELVIQGQSAFLQKPYAPGELCRAIRALASQDRQPA